MSGWMARKIKRGWEGAAMGLLMFVAAGHQAVKGLWGSAGVLAACGLFFVGLEVLRWRNR